MKKQTSNKHKQPAAHPESYAAAEPIITEQIRRLVYTCCANRGGPDHMSLNDWRDLELQLKGKLENERSKPKRRSKPAVESPPRSACVQASRGGENSEYECHLR